MQMLHIFRYIIGRYKVSNASSTLLHQPPARPATPTKQKPTSIIVQPPAPPARNVNLFVKKERRHHNHQPFATDVFLSLFLTTSQPSQPASQPAADARKKNGKNCFRVLKKKRQNLFQGVLLRSLARA